LNTEGVGVADKIGQGFYFLNQAGVVRQGGVIDVIVSGTGSLEFDLVGTGPVVFPGMVLATGKLDGSPNGNLTLTLGPNETSSGDWNRGYGLELDLMFGDGLIVSPTSAMEAEINTSCFSASAKIAEQGVQLTRSSTQVQSFIAKPSMLPYLVNQHPIIFQPGEQVTFSGGNLGTDPEVIFDLGDSLRIAEPTVLDGTNELTCTIPNGVQGNQVQIQNMNGQGTGLWTPTLFNPSLVVTRIPPDSTGGFGLNLRSEQESRQLTLADWQLKLLNTLVDLSGLSPGMRVGSFMTDGGDRVSNEENSDLTVQSLSGDQLILQCSKGTITIDRSLADETVVIEFYPEEPISQPQVNGFPATMQMTLDGISFAAGADGALPLASSSAVSAPTQLLGEGTGIEALQFIAF
jgi:hypothetical protein